MYIKKPHEVSQKVKTILNLRGKNSFKRARQDNFQDLKPQDSFGRFVKIFLNLQKVDHTIRKHH